MNIFNKYGIKEVADVVFYSITRIGDEEFYTPVLFFDSLKVSGLTKTIENVNAKGGKGNGKILAWNFESDSKLKLEDALFSQMSLDVFMNGRAMAKMSNWTSAIAKLNVANKFGQKNYSIKAFPSPILNKEEEEIVFRNAQKAGYNSKTGNCYSININSHETKYLYDSNSRDSQEDTYVAENRKNLMENYYKRTQPTPHSRDLSEYVDFNFNHYDGVQILLSVDKQQEKEEALQLKNLNNGEEIEFYRDMQIILHDKENNNYENQNFLNTSPAFSCKIRKTIDGYIGLLATIDNSKLTGLAAFPQDFFPQIQYSNKFYDIGNEFFLSHLPFFLFPNYLELVITNLCYCDQKQNFQLAMPQKIINEIIEEIDSFNKIGRFENDLYEIDTIDRFEKCIVNKKDGLEIDLTQQLINLKKQYQNEKDNYIIFYDEKTMLPFMLDTKLPEKIYTQKSIRLDGEITEERILSSIQDYFRNIMGNEWAESLTLKDYDYSIIGNEIKFRITKHEYMKIKYGTVYYKWSRTINIDNTNSSFIGTELSIDIDTFPGEYMIVGETFIREQKTGKDQRYQFIINRAAISSTTKIQLQAGGEPTTFSIDIDLLVPKTNKKSTLEMRQYNVEEDEFNGGNYIVPQNKTHSYTVPIQSYDEVIISNDEIY